MSVAIAMIQAIGTAILVAAIFTFASGTSEFINKIRGLLQDIVVTRDFLGNIDTESKRETLSSLLKPSESARNTYSNIGDYYNVYINQTLNISNKCVRSNYNIHCRAFFDTAKRKVAIESGATYRLYPTADGYDNIDIGFAETDPDSRCDFVAVSNPSGDRTPFNDPRPTLIDRKGNKLRLVTVDLKDLGRDCERLDIELGATEYGSEDWIPFEFQALQPTDGFQFHLRCDEPAEIRQHLVFIVGAHYYADLKSTKELAITCNQWINEGDGVAILVAIPHLATSLPGHVATGRPAEDADAAGDRAEGSRSNSALQRTGASPGG